MSSPALDCTADARAADVTPSMDRSGTSRGGGRRRRWRVLSRRASFWTAALVIGLTLWSSASPSLVNPLYAAHWSLSPIVITLVFATYQLVLVPTLLLFGGISDVVGRRASMLAGLGAFALGGIVFAIAPAMEWLFVGRALQGIGAGLALGAATAALRELDLRGDVRRVGSITTLAQAGGLTVAQVVTGALVTYAPLPRHLGYLVLLAAVIVGIALVSLMPDDRPPAARGLREIRPQPVGVPAGTRLSFALAATSMSIAFALGALFLSLGAQLAEDILQTHNALEIASVLAAMTVVIGTAGVTLRSLPPRTAVALGGISAAVGLGLLVLTSHTGSVALFVLTSAVLGLSYALAMLGPLRLVTQDAPAHHRASVVSALYLVAYVIQGAAAIIIGLIATRVGIQDAVDLVAPVMAGLGLVLAVAAVVVSSRTRRRSQASGSVDLVRTDVTPSSSPMAAARPVA